MPDCLMRRNSSLAVALLFCAPLHGAEKISFNRDIRPIFSDTCFQCHGPDEAIEADLFRGPDGWTERENASRETNDAWNEAAGHRG